MIPPPVEPAAQTRQDSSSIHIGTKIGHCPKSVEEKPHVVAMVTTLKDAKRSAVHGSGYVPTANRYSDATRQLITSTATIALASGSRA